MPKTLFNSYSEILKNTDTKFWKFLSCYDFVEICNFKSSRVSFMLKRKKFQNSPYRPSYQRSEKKFHFPFLTRIKKTLYEISKCHYLCTSYRLTTEEASPVQPRQKRDHQFRKGDCYWAHGGRARDRLTDYKWEISAGVHVEGRGTAFFGTSVALFCSEMALRISICSSFHFSSFSLWRYVPFPFRHYYIRKLFYWRISARNYLRHPRNNFLFNRLLKHHENHHCNHLS